MITATKGGTVAGAGRKGYGRQAIRSGVPMLPVAAERTLPDLG